MAETDVELWERIIDMEASREVKIIDAGVLHYGSQHAPDVPPVD